MTMCEPREKHNKLGKWPGETKLEHTGREDKDNNNNE